MEPILIEGTWQQAKANGSFRVQNPGTRADLGVEFPISSWADCDRILDAAAAAARVLRGTSGEAIAAFLEDYASRIEARADEIVQTAHNETALPVEPRLRNVELPRTTTQLRQAAQAAKEGSWQQPVIDTKLNIRSCFASIGPVVVFGPNNFPFAFNGISGGDFAAAIAAGCPVIAKAHPLHAGTSKLLAECALEALRAAGLPPAAMQMIYNLEPADGLKLVSDPRVAATGFTGSRGAGLRLKEAAEKAGRVIYLELSSLNPIIYLPGAIAERRAELVTETADSGLAAAGQFCTSPNLLFLVASPDTKLFIEELTAAYASRPSSPLLSAGGLDHLQTSVKSLVSEGASVLTGAEPKTDAPGFCFRNTVLQVSGKDLIAKPGRLQQEAFGNATMVVLCDDVEELKHALASLEGNLTAAIYSSKAGADDALYPAVAEILRSRCGRLLNDKMPTGVALSPAMNHGGPFPSTGHPGFTAVGIPRSIQRFGALQCYDGVRHNRLPAVLQDKAPHENIWRMVDGAWVKS